MGDSCFVSVWIFFRTHFDVHLWTHCSRVLIAFPWYFGFLAAFLPLLGRVLQEKLPMSFGGGERSVEEG